MCFSEKFLNVLKLFEDLFRVRLLNSPPASFNWRNGVEIKEQRCSKVFIFDKITIRVQRSYNELIDDTLKEEVLNGTLDGSDSCRWWG